jgi:hypothetical protein
MSDGAPPRVSPNPKSSAASSATSLAKSSAISASSQTSPTLPHSPLDEYRSIYELAETINGLYKAEVIHRRGPWKTFDAVELATLERVDWFNHRRRLEPIGNIPPAEAEERYYAMLDQPALAA